MAKRHLANFTVAFLEWQEAGLIKDNLNGARADLRVTGGFICRHNRTGKKRRALRLASQHERVYMYFAVILREQQQKEWSGEYK